MHPIDIQSVEILNHWASLNHATIAADRLLAKWPDVIAIIAVLAMAIWDRPHALRILVSVALAAALGLLFNRILGHWYFQPRPFALDIGRQLLSHRANNSFPSNHATFVFGIAAWLLIHARYRVWGIGVLGLGLLCALARIAAAIHFPSDMLGSLAAGIAAAGLVLLAEYLAITRRGVRSSSSPRRLPAAPRSPP